MGYNAGVGDNQAIGPYGGLVVTDAGGVRVGGLELAAMATNYANGAKYLINADGNYVAINGVSDLLLDGDSLLAQNNSLATNGVYNNVQGVGTWVQDLLGQRLTSVTNVAVAGSTMTDVLARLPALSALQFNVCFFADALNDIAAGRSAARICADLETYWKYMGSRNVRLYHLAPYPPYAVAPSNPFTAAMYQTLLQVRDYVLRAQARVPHLTVVDMFELLATVTATPTPTIQLIYSSDAGGAGFHFNGAGAFQIASQVADALYSLVPPANNLIASAADTYGVDPTTPNPNLWDNPLFTGNGGTKGTGAADATAWVTLTVYEAGRVVLNGGNAYIALAGGTSGVTPPTHVGAAIQNKYGELYWDPVTVSDGTVAWAFVGPAAVAGVANLFRINRNAGAGTAYCCTVDAPDLIGKMQVVGMVGATATDVFQLAPITGFNTRAVNGGTYEGTARTHIIGSTSGLNAPTLRTLATVAGVTTQSRDMSASTTLQDSRIPQCVLRQKVPPVTIGAGSITVVEVQSLATFAAASARACMGISRLSFRKTV